METNGKFNQQKRDLILKQIEIVINKSVIILRTLSNIYKKTES